MQWVGSGDATAKFMQELKMRVFRVQPGGSVLRCVHNFCVSSQTPLHTWWREACVNSKTGRKCLRAEPAFFSGEWMSYPYSKKSRTFQQAIRRSRGDAFGRWPRALRKRLLALQ